MDLIIQKTILEMEKPFLMSDLFNKLALVGITDKEVILNVLDELLNIGLVEYSDVNDDLSVYYQSAFAIA